MRLLPISRRECWVVALTVRQIAGVCRNRRGGIDNHFIQECPAITDGNCWQQALDALSTWLTHKTRPVHLRLILSDQFVRYALIPWSPGVTSPMEMERLGRAYLEQWHGTMENWQISIDHGEYGLPRLVCALPSAFQNALMKTLEQGNNQYAEITPYLVTCWNRWRHNIPSDALLAIAENSGPAMLLSIRGGIWQNVRLVSGPQNQESLERLLTREALLQGFETAPATWIHCAGLPDSGRRKTNSTMLDATSPVNQPALDIACVGAGL